MKSDTTIVFMGTPQFAVHSLKKILDAKHSVLAVITPPDKPAGRGLKMQPSVVKQFAIENNLLTLQPKSLKSKSFIKQMEVLCPDIIVVVAFKKIPKEIFSIPKLGIFNLHASLLPQYRGAAPINWALINGEIKTGVTTFLLDEKIDTGKILLQKEVAISPNINAGELHNQLMELGGELVIETIEKMSANSITPQNQPNHIELREAPKLYPTICKIYWEKPLLDIHNFVRGLSPFPGSWTNFMINNQQKKVKILSGDIVYSSEKKQTPSIEIRKDELVVKNFEGYYKIQTLQIEGKKPMDARAFINGYKNVSLAF
jgi:methionyl-tRNA formyltransferase